MLTDLIPRRSSEVLHSGSRAGASDHAGAHLGSTTSPVTVSRVPPLGSLGPSPSRPLGGMPPGPAETRHTFNQQARTVKMPHRVTHQYPYSARLWRFVLNVLTFRPFVRKLRSFFLLRF